MPKFPKLAARVADIPGSVYERFGKRLKAQGKNLIKLHIGDTYQHPLYPLPIDASFKNSHPDFNRYVNTYGIHGLRIALAEKVSEDNGLTATRDNILITGGAVNALNIAMMSLIDPGDEVLVLTPCWPFFPGIVKLVGGRVTELPFYTDLYQPATGDVTANWDAYLTPRTAALYLNTPNNPSGKVLRREHLEQIARWVSRHNLWLISDEAYDGLTFDGHRHISIGSLSGMAERTVSVFTFSKIFMFAGLRVGYLVADQNFMPAFNKVLVHQIYGPTTHAQYMMIEPVRTRHQWMPEVQRTYQNLRDQGLRTARFTIQKPEGSYFFFFSVKEYLKGRDYWDVIGACMDAGVAVAPGRDFGKDFGDYVRICFTGEPPEKMTAALEKLNAILC